MDQLRLVWQVGEHLLQMVPFREDPEGTRHSVLLAVQEMLTNVLRYAHAGDDEIPIAVTFSVDASGCEIVIEDQGAAFDPCAAPLPRMHDESMPSEPGGYGILIVRMVMDQVEHHRRDGRNVLCMRKSVGVAAHQQVQPELGV